MRLLIAISLVLSLLAITTTDALRCYTCDNQGFGEICVSDPASVPGGSSTCQAPNDEYCYTSRLEEADGRLTLNRGCCRVMDNSPVCPLGDDFQIVVNQDPPYVKYMTRCGEGDLCNFTAGDSP